MGKWLLAVLIAALVIIPCQTPVMAQSGRVTVYDRIQAKPLPPETGKYAFAFTPSNKYKKAILVPWQALLSREKLVPSIEGSKLWVNDSFLVRYWADLHEFLLTANAVRRLYMLTTL